MLQFILRMRWDGLLNLPASFVLLLTPWFRSEELSSYNSGAISGQMGYVVNLSVSPRHVLDQRQSLSQSYKIQSNEQSQHKQWLDFLCYCRRERPNVDALPEEL